MTTVVCDVCKSRLPTTGRSLELEVRVVRAIQRNSYDLYRWGYPRTMHICATCLRDPYEDADVGKTLAYAARKKTKARRKSKKPTKARAIRVRETPKEIQS